ncbi:hypothetical protein PTTG_28159, partial [Puccinia triticina 1-1 BBBD Race 1]
MAPLKHTHQPPRQLGKNFFSLAVSLVKNLPLRLPATQTISGYPSAGLLSPKSTPAPSPYCPPNPAPQQPSGSPQPKSESSLPPKAPRRLAAPSLQTHFSAAPQALGLLSNSLCANSTSVSTVMFAPKALHGSLADQAPSSRRYEARISRLEEMVQLLLAGTDSRRPALVSSGTFRYSIEKGLVPLLSATTVESLESDCWVWGIKQGSQTCSITALPPSPPSCPAASTRRNTSCWRMGPSIFSSSNDRRRLSILVPSGKPVAGRTDSPNSIQAGALKLFPKPPSSAPPSPPPPSHPSFRPTESRHPLPTVPPLAPGPSKAPQDLRRPLSTPPECTTYPSHPLPDSSADNIANTSPQNPLLSIILSLPATLATPSAVPASLTPPSSPVSSLPGAAKDLQKPSARPLSSPGPPVPPASPLAEQLLSTSHTHTSPPFSAHLPLP